MKIESKKYIHPFTHYSKRIIDIISSLSLMIILLPLMLLIALLIKVDSKGPIFYRQLRIGKSFDKFTQIFHVIKFRSMIHNAEETTGPVWASKNDSRITRIGLFLRKTRIDELPQLFNVLIGDMSMIGPRPERPVFYQTLDKKIAFYADRTFNVTPGITGLAQVNHGYDSSIEDVRKKIEYDHIYTLSLFHPLNWIIMDIKIIMQTVYVILTKKGR